jgi:heavy metal sensor kinase
MSSATTKRRRFLRTIGVRLTVWGAGVTLCVCALVCLVLYVGLFYSLRHEIDAFLEGDLREFIVTIDQHADDDAALERAIRRELGSRTRRDLAFRLFDLDGHLIVSSEPNDELASLWAAPPGSVEKPPYVHLETARSIGQPYGYRTCSRRITTSDGRSCTAQASYCLERMMTSLALFRRVCAVVLALAVILAIVSGRILARRSLRPLQALTQTAQRIGANSLTERVPMAGTDDELDRLAQTINNMLDRIERHVRQVRQFTADASHELRSPLAALRGNAEVALSHPRSADEFHRVIEESIEHYDRLTRTAEALLLLSRADAGHEILRHDSVRLDRAIEDVLDLYGPLAQDRGIDLTFEARPQVQIEADGPLLRQLIGNLIDNAIKYTGPRGHVTVTLSQTDGVADLTVTDTGVGIAPEHLPYGFERFYRVDTARSPQRGGGAGLGLCICKTIAEAHGGSIAVQSAPSNGTMVSVRLPS